MKLGFASNRLTWSRVDPPGLYWSEEALQYRYAKMVAEGEAIPSHDEKLMYPDGVRTFQYLTVFLEYLIGYSYRLVGYSSFDVPFHVFATWFTSFFLTLSAISVYFFSVLVFRSHLAGVLSSLLYAFSTPSASRSILSCNREDIALPFLFGATVLLAASLSYRPRIMAIAGCLLMAISLAAWHFSRFYFFAFAVALCIVYLAAPRKELRRLAFMFCLLTAISIIAGLTVPVLRASRFWCSPHAIVCLAVSVSVLWEMRRERARGHDTNSLESRGWAIGLGRAIRIAVVAAPLFGLTCFLATEQAAYGHVWELLVEKVRHLGVKPDDPSVLPFEARALWIEGFNGPALHHILTSFWAIIPIGLFAIVRIGLAMGTEKYNPSGMRAGALLLLVLLAIIFVGLYLFIGRLSVFVVFFTAVLCGGAVYGLSSRVSWVVAGCLIPFALLLAYGFQDIRHQTVLHRAIDRVIGYEHQPATFVWKVAYNDQSLVNWVQDNTPPDSVFVSRFFVAPLLLTYADRAIVVQPKWEVPGSRERVRRIHEAFYGTEEALAGLCDELGAQYYLLDGRATLDASQDGDRYTADALRLATSTPAYRMQFAPELLTRFRLVYQNRYYRLFHLVGDDPHNDASDFPGNPFYDITRFGGQTGKEAFFDDQYTADVVQECRHAEELLTTGTSALKRGSYGEANRCFMEALHINPSIHGGHLLQGVALLEMGRLQQAAEEVSKEVAIHPYCPMAAYQLGHIRFVEKKWRKAFDAFESCYELDPEFPGIAERIGEAQRAMERQRKAPRRASGSG